MGNCLTWKFASLTDPASSPAGSFVAVAAALLFAASAQAAPTAAFDFSAPGVVARSSSYSLGYEFDVLAPVDVVGLGFFDSFQDGLTESHPVGIYDSAGTLLVSSIISPSDPLSGHFRYHDIAPFRLSIGTGYRIAAVNGSEAYGLRALDFTVDASLTFIRNRYSAANTWTLVFPDANTWAGDDPGYFGPNFQLVPVPEAETWAMMLAGLGLAGLAAHRGQRQRR